MNIGLLGFGVVGRGVYEITRERVDMQVTKVLCLEDINLPDAQAVKNIRDIVEDETIDTVVEAMGGLHPAYEFVRAAIEAGKNVVTSNKALVCTFYDELLPWQMRRVSASVPLPLLAAASAGSASWSAPAVSRRLTRLAAS